MIFDVRFLDNPFYVEELKEKTGQDEEVRDFVLGIGLGASAMSVFLVAVRKWYRKIVCPGSGFLAETLEKGRKKR